jgi:tetratricopeptide (TPR) repeat protein
MTARAVWDNLTPRNTHVLEGLKQLDVAKQIVVDFAAANQVPLSDSQAIELAQKAHLHPRLIQFSVEQLHNDETDLVTILRRLDDLENEQRDYTIEELLDEMIRQTVEHMAKYARHGADAKALLSNLTILKGFFPDAAIQAVAPESLNDEDALLHARETLQKWQFLRRDRVTKRFTLGELVPEALGRPHDDVFWAYAGFYTRRAGEIYSLGPENWKDYDDELPNVLAVGDALVTAIPNIISTLNKDREIEELEKNHLEMALVFFLDTRDFVTDRLEFQRISWLRIGTIVAEFMNEGRYQGILLHSLAFALSLTGNNQEAVNYYEQALPITSEHGDRIAEGTVLNNLGRVWTQLGDAEKATYYLEKALPIRRELKDIDGETATLNNLGMLADSLGDKQQALKYYRRADKICSEVKDKRIQANTYSNMGTILDALGRGDEALKYYERAFAICSRIGDRRGAAIILNNTGKLYASLGNSEEAFNRFYQALEAHNAVGNVLDAATTLNNIGTLLIETGQAKESFEHLNKALNIQVSMEDQRGQATTLANIGMAHHALKENLTAIESLKQAIDKFTLCGDRYSLVSANANISVVYQEIGQLDNAMKYMRDAIQTGASIEHPHVQMLSGQYAILVTLSMYK